MPLLGRHKSLGGSTSSAAISSASAASSQANAAAAASANQQRRVCESPLFGVRRQLPLNTVTSSGNSSATGAGSQQLQDTELSSVPQQITRQQIHYAFSIMDVNKDGMIDMRELSQMLANLGVPIDEAILSHIMLSVSKRGDHQISEAEFFNWIAHFIQVQDTSTTQADHSSGASGPRTRRLVKNSSAAGASSSAGGRVTRSSTASSSLVAEPNEAPRTRRGSGSGLALMRSLSSSAASPPAAAAAISAQQQQQQKVATGSSHKSRAMTGRPLRGSSAAAATAMEPTAESEARNDLKAAFCVFDLDGDGYITFDEVRAGLKLLGESWSPNELRQVFSKFSGNAGSTGATGQRTANDLSRQRISIDDFVQLLL